MSKPTYLQERVRCLHLVEAYRERLEEVVRKSASTKLAQLKEIGEIADKVAASLRRIEMEIKSPRNRTGADFTIDEIEKAQALIDEYHNNPFDVES